MKRFFDSSILVAAFVSDEVHHSDCLNLISEPVDALVYSHGLTECFSILTGSRLGGRVSADQAAALLKRNIAEKMEIVSLTVEEKLDAFAKSQDAGIRGGAIYDFLHLAAARKANADEIYTLNVRHFSAFAPDLNDIIRRPGES